MEQRLVQSPQMIQTMQILQLSSLELQERTEQELMENPFLERAEYSPSEEGGEEGPAPPGEGVPEPRTLGETPPERTQSREEEDRSVVADEFDRLWIQDELQGRVTQAGSEASDRKQEALANTPDRPRTLASALVDELAGIDLTDRQHELAEFLIYSLDERGYLTEPLDQLAHERALTAELAELERNTSAAEDRPLAALPDDASVEATVEELEEVLEKLRAAIHPALGAQELKEALRLQLEHRGWDTPLMIQLVDEHLEDVVKNRLPRIVKATGCEIDELKQAIERLRELDLSPGADYDEDLAAVITPDVIVEELDGRFEVRLARERQPNLRISPVYRELLEGLEQARQADRQRRGDAAALAEALDAAPALDASGANAALEGLAEPGTPPEDGSAPLPLHEPAGEPSEGAAPSSREALHLDDPEEARRWARRKLESARWFIEAVEQRGGTMLRIAKEIFRRQERFLIDGPKGLQPMRMQEVADAAGVHISTVSRAVAGKYAQTPRGIHPLKYFFTSGTTDSSGEAQSQVGIQQRLQELVRGEDPENPLSDDQIAAELMRREGIRLARRTVTKYRLALGIPSSSQRKRF
jgi:DNA-directed RNA polymerase specialized sigma54-like protein